MSPEQQSTPLAQSDPLVPHGWTHFPVTHSSPVQQSTFVVQSSELALQGVLQKPFWHAVPSQQSEVFVQLLPSLRQHEVPPTQLEPGQHE
jgi:hypothetical protein